MGSSKGLRTVSGVRIYADKNKKLVMDVSHKKSNGSERSLTGKKVMECVSLLKKQALNAK